MATLKGNLPFCRVLVRDLAALPGVQRVAANDVTGSIVVHYDPMSLSVAGIFRVFQRRNLLHNVIGFPNAPARPLRLAQTQTRTRTQALQLETWLSETVSTASRAVIRTLLEVALQKTSQLLLKKILL